MILTLYSYGLGYNKVCFAYFDTMEMEVSGIKEEFEDQKNTEELINDLL